MSLFLRKPALVAGLWVLCALLLTSSGCGNPSSMDLSLNQSQAEECLKVFLETWKANEKPSSLASKSPAIVGYDAAWEAGIRLRDYRIEKTTPDGGNLFAVVHLTLGAEDEVTEERDMTYIVTTSPKITVFPEREVVTEQEQ